MFDGLLLHNLSANLAGLVRRGVDIDVQLAIFQLGGLRIGQRRVALDRTFEVAVDRHQDRRILPRLGRAVEMRGGGRTGEARIGDGPGQLLGRRVVGGVHGTCRFAVVRRDFGRGLQIGLVRHGFGGSRRRGGKKGRNRRCDQSCADVAGVHVGFSQGNGNGCADG